MSRKVRRLTKVLALTMTLAMMLGVATVSYAETFTWQEPTTQIAGNPNEKYITTSAHRAAQTISEIVGLTNTCGQNLGGDAVGLVDGMSDEGEPTSLEAGRITPILGLFGSNLNDAPDPYYFNYFYNLYAKENGLGTSDYGIYYIPAKTGPNNADTIANPAYGGQISSLIRRPDILIGTTKVNGVGYEEEIAELPENKDNDPNNNYDPVLFSYKYRTIYQISTTMKKLAQEMHQIADKTGKTWRYDDPSIIAGDYEKYMVGLSAYVKSELAAKGLKEKKVAIVDPAHSDVSGAGTFRAYDDTCTSAVAQTCRVTESVAQAVDNIGADLKANQAYTSTLSGSEEAAFYLTAQQILSADVIITCGIQSDEVVSTDSFKAELMNLTGCKESDIPRIIDTQPDCIYGLHVNSSESAVGVGYFLGAIYGDEIDLNPVYYSAYFYQKFLHVNDPDALQTAIRNNLSAAVQSLGSNVTTDLTGYNAAKCEDAIIEGMHYYEGHTGEFHLLDTRGDNAEVHQVTFDWTKGIGSKASDVINIISNGKTVDCASYGQEPVITNDRTMVPFRAVSEALGAEVGWDDPTRTVTASLDGTNVSLVIGQSFITVNGQQKAIDSPSYISNDRTLVPFRAIAEAFGKTVTWNGNSRTVIIK